MASAWRAKIFAKIEWKDTSKNPREDTNHTMLLSSTSANKIALPEQKKERIEYLVDSKSGGGATTKQL